MKLTGIIFFACFIFFSPFLFAQAEDRVLPDPNNPDCMYEKAQLGELFIHMAKITDPSKGSAPAVEVLFNSDFNGRFAAPMTVGGGRIKHIGTMKKRYPVPLFFLLLPISSMM